MDLETLKFVILQGGFALCAFAAWWWGKSAVISHSRSCQRINRHTMSSRIDVLLMGRSSCVGLRWRVIYRSTVSPLIFRFHFDFGQPALRIPRLLASPRLTMA